MRAHTEELFGEREIKRWGADFSVAYAPQGVIHAGLLCKVVWPLLMVQHLHLFVTGRQKPTGLTAQFFRCSDVAALLRGA